MGRFCFVVDGTLIALMGGWFFEEVRCPDNMDWFSTILLFGGKIKKFKLFVCRGLCGICLFFLVEFRMKSAGLCKGVEKVISNIELINIE